MLLAHSSWYVSVQTTRACKQCSCTTGSIAGGLWAQLLCRGMQTPSSGRPEPAPGSPMCLSPPGPATQCSSRIPSGVTGQPQLPLMGLQIYWKSWRLPRYPQDLGWAGASAPGQAASPHTQRGGELRPSYAPSPPLAVRHADFKHWFI